MNFLSAAMPDGDLNETTSAFLRASVLFDDDFYRRQVLLSPDVDAALHYMVSGWRDGLQPNEHFDGHFLQPFYRAAGFDAAPALTWADLSALGGSPLPVNAHHASALAAELREVPLFDPSYYARNLPDDIDPAIHYVVVGERLGWRPSEGFDPAFYAESYPDILTADITPLKHYWFHGRLENRSCLSAADRLEFPPFGSDDTRPVVLVVSHEASRTGAPILGWNIIRNLNEKYRVVSLLMKGGSLEESFAEISSAQVGPMDHSEWQPAQALRMAEEIVRRYRPIFAITNSVETHLMVPALALKGVPSVALVHEFMSYTGNAEIKMSNLYDWASNVIFPARIVAQSSYDRFPRLEYRKGQSIIPQGRSDLPPSPEVSADETATERLLKQLRPQGHQKSFLVLGVGTVELRKGTDLFVAVAASIRRRHPDIPIRFVWIGGGYDPDRDMAFSSFLADQIKRSDLSENLVILDPVSNLEPAYDEADAFLMCSRLDPQPNVGIDAVSHGLPTICFELACGTGEVLADRPETRGLVVPYLDVQAAADLIAELASDPGRVQHLQDQVAKVGAETFDMSAYVATVDTLGREAHRQELDAEADLSRLAEADVVERDMAQRPADPVLLGKDLARFALKQWSLWNMLDETNVSTRLRRPIAGFNPQIYAKAHAGAIGSTDRNPLSHWLESGRPKGLWSYPVYRPNDDRGEIHETPRPRVALHGHFFYTDLAFDLYNRLDSNELVPDLFLTTETEEKGRELTNVFRRYGGKVEVEVVPNRGRDIGPFLTALGPAIQSGLYDVFGHIHGKKTLSVGGTVGDRWRDFLWENLVGGEYPMLDFIASTFAENEDIGLLMAAEPHLVGWEKNRDIAETLAERMKLPLPLDDFFDFPVGTMFWARPAALQPLFDLGLDWSDYPEEPVPYDGSILHAIERLLPFVVRHTDHTVAGVHVPGTSW